VLLILSFGSRHGAKAADDQMTGDWGGLRSALSKAGFDLGAIYIGETFGNLRASTGTKPR
jgi:carbohydrate-selective porin OprB